MYTVIWTLVRPQALVACYAAARRRLPARPSTVCEIALHDVFLDGFLQMTCTGVGLGLLKHRILAV